MLGDSLGALLGKSDTISPSGTNSLLRSVTDSEGITDGTPVLGDSEGLLLGDAVGPDDGFRLGMALVKSDGIVVGVSVGL